MIYHNKETKWIIVLSFFVISNLIINLLYQKMEISWFIVLHGVFSLGSIVALLYLLKNISKLVHELKTSNMKLQTIFETMDIAIWYQDFQTNKLLITSGIEKIYGHSIQAFQGNHNLWREAVHPKDHKIIEERLERLNNMEEVISIYRIMKPDGNIRWVKDKGIPLFNSSGEMIEFTSVVLDITDKKESEDKFSTLVEMSPDIIAVSSNYNLLYINKAGSKLIGANNPHDLIGKTVTPFFSKENYEQIKQEFANANSIGKQYIEIETQIHSLNNQLIDLDINCMPILFEGKEAVLVIGRDITERKKADNLIKNLAFYDTLTTLPNRNKCLHYLNERLLLDSVKTMHVLFLDLDHFKRINDTKGHSIGDLILKMAAERLQAAVKPNDFVARLGGDEFLVILENKSKLDVLETIHHIMDNFSHPLIAKKEEFFVTPSIGISLYPTDGIDQETLIKSADAAMYLAKEKGKNNFQFYSSALQARSTRKMELEMALRKAITNKELFLYYQPQIVMETGEIHGVEALLRWNHPLYGNITPLEFIPLAEETNLILSIGDWVINEAFAQLDKWSKQGINNLKMSINISARQFQSNEFIQRLKDQLEKYSLNPSQIELEITESIMQNIDSTISILNEIKKIGFKISIDDFGTGYSSLSYLKYLPIDTLKIDKSFIDDIEHPVHKGSLVKAIIDMGHNMNFTVIAEGIENDSQIDFLQRHHCYLGQGYYYSKPLPLDKLETYIKNVKKK